MHVDGVALVIETNDVRIVARQRTHSLLDTGIARIAVRILLRKNHDLLWLDAPHFHQVVHHRVRLFGIARPIVEDVAIGRIPAKKIGAGERPEKQCSMVECEGQRNRRRRRSDVADEAEDMVVVAKDLHGVGCARRLVAVVRRHEFAAVVLSRFPRH